jgi:hypothetical protein
MRSGEDGALQMTRRERRAAAGIIVAWIVCAVFIAASLGVGEVAMYVAGAVYAALMNPLVTMVPTCLLAAWCIAWCISEYKSGSGNGPDEGA